MSKHIFKKFERNQIPPKFRIGCAEFKILELLADYRFLDTRQILALCPDKAQRTAKRKLQYLFQAGFIERPAQQFSYYKPSNFLVYALAKKGAQLIFQEKGLSIQSKPSKEIGVTFLRHFLMISEFRAALSLALGKTGQAKIAVWSELGAIDAVLVDGERQPIAPDAFFTIEDKSDVMHFFLEADRSTMAGGRISKKLKAYWEWWRQGKQEQLLGITDFRVLTLAISEERKENLRLIGQSVGSEGQGSNIFWFACEKSYSLENPQSILQSIWQTSKNEALHHILE